jgi:hypothetical protein
MKPAYDLYSWNIDGLIGSDAVHYAHTILTKHGAELSQDCVLMLAEDAEESPLPVGIEDPEAALARLSTWPSLGSIEYHLDDVSIIVTFHTSESNDTGAHCIQMSVSSDWFDRLRPVSEQTFGAIASEIHAITMADRTVMRWTGRPLEVTWDEELIRLQSGAVEGEYDVDLYRVPPDRGERGDLG